MLRRKIEAELLAWKNRGEHTCLVVKGARQVGKTFIIEKFAREHYAHIVTLNFIENPGYTAIFDGELSADNLVKQISVRVPGAELVPHETLIFLDEIQHCPNARAALKFLAIDGRFDVIASGSLLGINYKDVPSFPVGYTEHLDMYSLDFEEFLWANGIHEEDLESLRHSFTERQPVLPAIHERMMELFRDYILVGGMPKAVSEFVESHNLANVLRLQRNILRDYEDDIAKYAEGSEKAKARACFLSIPRQLARDYKKFQYSVVEKKGTAAKFGGSLMWLYDAGIINFCYNLSRPELPLEGNVREDCFKVYMRDTGLLLAMLEDGAQEDILDGNLGIYKGAVYENVIADILGKSGRKLYYFERNSQLEIDFIIRLNRKAAAVEVKSAENTRSKSLMSLLKSGEVTQGVKLSGRNIEVRGATVNYPLYMAMFL